MADPTVALVTCAAHPDLDEDDRPLVAALRERGVEALPAVWDDEHVDWSSSDLAVIRSTWDYTDRAEAFVDWAASVPALANPAEVVRWNVDKRYLADVAAAGIPVVPTTYVAPGEPVGAVPHGEVVVKPTVSAGSRDTLRLADPSEVARHIEHIHGTGRTAMVQPYLAAVDEAGETATVFLDGRFSHAARKGPLLPRGGSLVEGLFAREEMSARAVTRAEREVAEAALHVVPGGPAALLYARVDLILDDAGQPVVLEVEVVEPSLFLAIGAAVDRFADAIATRLRTSQRRARGRRTSG